MNPSDTLTNISPMMDAAQFYETTIYDRKGGRAFTFVTLPARALVTERPDIEEITASLGVHRVRSPSRRPLAGLEPIEPWSLPFVIDGLLGRWNGRIIFDDWRWRYYPFGPDESGPSPFAQYLAYEPVLPFESSAVKGTPLSHVAVGAGTAGMIGIIDGHPVVLIVALGGVVLGGATQGIAEAMQIGLRTRILRLMGIDDDEPSSEHVHD